MTFRKLSIVLFFAMIGIINPLTASDPLESREDESSASQLRVNQKTLVALFRDIKIGRLTSLEGELIKMEEVCKAFEQMVSASPLNQERAITFLGMIFGEYVGDYNAVNKGVLPFLPTPWSIQEYLEKIKDPDCAFCLSTQIGGKLYNGYESNGRGDRTWALRGRRLNFAPFWTNDIHKIVVLNLSNNFIAFLPDMRHWGGLTELDLSHNRLTSLKHLERLVNLRKLSVEGNQISDLSPIANMIKLSTLFISANPIRSLRPLVSLANLNTLHSRGLKRGEEHLPMDWKNLGKLEKLLTLSLDNNNIVAFDPIVVLLGKLPDILELSLERNSIGSLLPIHHDKLRILNLKGNPIRSITSLRGLSGLSGLLVDLSNLEGPKNLEELKNWVEPVVGSVVPDSVTPSVPQEERKVRKKKNIEPPAPVGTPPLTQVDGVGVRAPMSDLSPPYPVTPTHALSGANSIAGWATIDGAEATLDGGEATPLLTVNPPKRQLSSDRQSTWSKIRSFRKTASGSGFR